MLKDGEAGIGYECELPTDIRHNSKIRREELAKWSQQRTVKQDWAIHKRS